MYESCHIYPPGYTYSPKLGNGASRYFIDVHDDAHAEIHAFVLNEDQEAHEGREFDDAV